MSRAATQLVSWAATQLVCWAAPTAGLQCATCAVLKLARTPHGMLLPALPPAPAPPVPACAAVPAAAPAEHAWPPPPRQPAPRPAAAAPVQPRWPTHRGLTRERQSWQTGGSGRTIGLATCHIGPAQPPWLPFSGFTTRQGGILESQAMGTCCSILEASSSRCASEVSSRWF